MKFVLSIDQGTTSSRVILVNQFGEVVSSAQQEFPQYFPKPGFVLHDPIEVFDSVVHSLQNCIKTSNVNIQDIVSVGITNQRETTVVWNKHTGIPIYPAIVWQSRQSEEIIKNWIIEFGIEFIQQKTGLIPDAYFSAGKISWILKHVEGALEMAKKGDLLFGTIDTWLMWKLSSGEIHATDVSNASRTMLFNIFNMQWDDELLEAFGIPTNMLPIVLDSCADFGSIKDEYCGKQLPITGVAGDQQAALFGQTCFTPGLVKNTYGTGCFMLMNIGTKPVISHQGLLTTVAWRIQGETTYALEGSVFVAGSAVQWIRDQLGLLTTASDSEAIAASVDDNGGVYFVPAFVGLGAPYWDQDARGAFFGLTRGSTNAHLTRAVLESMAFQTRDVMQLMQKESDLPIQELFVDGGAANNNLLMQFQSDQLQCKVNRPQNTESTALGAAFLSGLQAGVWKSLAEIHHMRKVDKVFVPSSEVGSSDSLYNRWNRAVEACRHFK
jgi:glycerol kinase